MADLYRVYRQKYELPQTREYLAISHTYAHWLSVDTYETWDECRKLASTFTDREAAMWMIIMQLHEPASVSKEYETETV